VFRELDFRKTCLDFLGYYKILPL